MALWGRQNVHKHCRIFRKKDLERNIFSWLSLNLISTIISVLYTHTKKLAVLSCSCQSFNMVAKLTEFLSSSIVKRAVEMLLYTWQACSSHSQIAVFLRKADLVFWDGVISERHCIPWLLLTACSQTTLEASYATRFVHSWSWDCWRR